MLKLTDYYVLEEDVSRLKRALEIKEKEFEQYKTRAARFSRKTYSLLKLLGLTDEEIATWYKRL